MPAPLQSLRMGLRARKCKDCVYYEEDLDGDNMKGHREKLTLDGECWSYQKKEE